MEEDVNIFLGFDDDLDRSDTIEEFDADVPK